MVGMPSTSTKSPLEVGDITDYSQMIAVSKMGEAWPKTDTPKLTELNQDGWLLLDDLVTDWYPLDGINESFAELKRSEALWNVLALSAPKLCPQKRYPPTPS